MSYEDFIRRGLPILLGVLILFTVIELSISAWLTAQFNQHHNFVSNSEQDRTRFLLFASMWTAAFSGVYLVFFFGLPDSIVNSVASYIIFLLITWIFWTAGAASITETLGGGLNCSNQTVFVYCGQLNALEAFAWIVWSLVTVTLIVVLFRGVLAARRGDGFKGSVID